MVFALGPCSEKAGYQLRAYDSIGSTNAEALALARAGETGPIWLVSAQQIAGYGRRKRAWHAPPGNLAASLLISTDLSQPVLASLGFVAALALNKAIADIAPEIVAKTALDGIDGHDRTRLMLKWPNDVLFDGAKLAGILIEIEPISDERRVVVIGIGVNVVAAPADLPYPATSLAALGSSCAAEDVFLALAEAWVSFHELWDEGRGLDDIRRLWLEQAAGLGAPVAIRLGDDIIRGTFETLDEEGRLIVLTEAGARRVIAAGEVHFGTAATMR
ncbi:biotin--[acetyl-CoA-carboxylase] ligase [Terrihabitans sp. B22-R8]|uniref:biotin--[acetyl-CoA-carboxylase] ligase n=1 Tax=Terrihabitans sp. B22-R8 TaxID=3425128 RepID=UPI00403C08B4